jgi:hypothetical protein
MGGHVKRGMNMGTRGLSVVILGFLLVGRAAAVAEAQSKNDLVVWVTTADSQERKGRLVSFTPERLIVRVGSVDATINTADILRVDTTDSISNGIRNGAIAGAIFGGLGLLAFSTCDGCGSGATAIGVFFMGFYTLAGAGTGALIDHAIEGRRPLYTRTPSRQVAVQPLISRRGAGVQFNIGW